MRHYNAKKSGGLQRTDKYHTSYLGYRYPLLFSYGEDGFLDLMWGIIIKVLTFSIIDSTQSKRDNEDIPW